MGAELRRGVGIVLLNEQRRVFVGKRFCMRYDGDGSDLDLDTHHDPEFTEWKWATVEQAIDGAIEFKRELYPTVFAAFAEFFQRGNRLSLSVTTAARVSPTSTSSPAAAQPPPWNSTR